VVVFIWVVVKVLWQQMATTHVYAYLYLIDIWVSVSCLRVMSSAEYDVCQCGFALPRHN